MMEKIINISLASFHSLRNPTVMSKWSRIMWVGNLWHMRLSGMKNVLYF